MKILGFSAFYHNSGAALVVDGEIVAAAQEERFSRKKRDARFPAGAVRYCLEEAERLPPTSTRSSFTTNHFSSSNACSKRISCLLRPDIRLSV
jgi:predicted NodU family carbamoyl transferase